MRLPWLLAALVLAALLASLHRFALAHFWYWEYPWFDVPMHFLAGVFMGTAVVGVLGRCKPKTFLLTVLAGALGWELFEYLVNVDREANFVLDTALDLLMDALGITLAYGIARLSVWR